MSTLADRLRRVMIPGASRRTHRIEHAEPGSSNAADVLDGQWCTSRDQPFLIVDRKYAAGHRHGHVSVLDSMPPDTGVWNRLPLLAGRAAEFQVPAEPTPRRLVFLDLETTGLAGGAGTYAFLVGCAWFEDAALRVRQFFLSSFTAERAILEAVAELAADALGVVTFNGRTFDVPLIDTRFALHRLASPFAALPHLDMLHVARRFWRRSEDEREDDSESDGVRSRGCRLSELEQTVCGHEREGDVPGFEIPARYFHYVRSGDARGLEAVLEHNRLDLISLAMLTARASQMLEDGPAQVRTAREALGLGAVYERAGLVPEALDAYAVAAGLLPSSREDTQVAVAGRVDATTRAEALRAYANLARRERRFEAAAVAWQHALDLDRCPPQIAREAAEALAVHHEHRERDLHIARRFALQSLQYRASATRTQAVRHRLDRLERKLGQSPSNEALF